jgi:hypothetical protein
MQVIGYKKKPDWPKLGPSILIATVLVVAIRTAKWAAKTSGGGTASDTDVELDYEVTNALRITMRVFHALLNKHAELFPQVNDPIMAPTEDESPR